MFLQKAWKLPLLPSWNLGFHATCPGSPDTNRSHKEKGKMRQGTEKGLAGCTKVLDIQPQPPSH